MALGFLVTVLTIRLLPAVADGVGWRWAMTVLAVGPVAGVIALRILLRTPAAHTALALERRLAR